MIKLCSGLQGTDADRLKRFEQEAKAAGSLNHPNILVIHDVGTHEGMPYLVSELLEGEPLSKRVQRVLFLQPKRSTTRSKSRTDWPRRTPEASCIAI